jgi:uncharacterized phage protein (TIGR02216 family)
MRFGLGRLRLPADHFWALTPMELNQAARAFVVPGNEPIDRAGLASLIARFPDFVDPPEAIT